MRMVPDTALIHEMVEYHAGKIPDHPAIDDGVRRVTYSELASVMRRLARLIRSLGTERNERVGLFLENGISAFQALLAILAADGCYVPLSPTLPVARNLEIIRDAGIRFIVTDRAHLEELDALVKSECLADVRGFIVPDTRANEAREALDPVCGDGFTVLGSENLAESSDLPIPYRNIEEDLAYIIYTSGTTGKPKGVMITHRNVKSYIRWAVDYFSIEPKDRIGNHAGLSFDLSVFDVFASFFAGATLCPVIEPGDRAFPGKFIRQRAITIWISVPSVLGVLIKSGQLTPNAFSEKLRCMILAGEPLATVYAAEWLKTHPDVPLFNLYGPTEATVLCTCHNVGRDTPFDPGKPVPIGRASRDSEILILKEHTDELADVGEPGRIMICGSQVAPGYWRRPDLTRERFLDNPFKLDLFAKMYDTGDWGYRDESGILHFLGRKDSQVKIMGYRVELGEIEVALQRHPLVAEAAALLMHEQSGPIVGVVALREPAPEGEAEMRSKEIDHQDTKTPRREDIEEELFTACEQLLPSYMVPRQISFFQELPKNVNGKIDRNAIRQSLLSRD